MSGDQPNVKFIPRKKKKARKSKSSDEGDNAEIKITFRNYAPSDAPTPADDASAPKASAAKQVEEQIEKELQQSIVTSKDEAVSITAKSPDWDLKRDIADKLKKLDRMTLRAIRELAQEKLAEEEDDDSSSGDDSSSDDESGSSSSDDDDDDDSNDGA